MNIKLSILIATTEARTELFKTLMDEFTKQIRVNHLSEKVEILYDNTGKHLPLGAKRQMLLEQASGEFIVFMDDDDWPTPNYLKTIVSIIENNEVDCIGFKIRMTTNGLKEQVCDHSLRHAKEGWTDNAKGFDYIRNVTMFNPVRRGLALQAGFPDLRWGEDHWFADRVTPLCKTEFYIEDQPYMFHYRFSTAESNATKYGHNHDKK